MKGVVTFPLVFAARMAGKRRSHFCGYLSKMIVKVNIIALDFGLAPAGKFGQDGDAGQSGGRPFIRFNANGAAGCYPPAAPFGPRMG